jgi:hypothetical protein
MPQCYGRLIKEKYRERFEGGGAYFHLPLRCERIVPDSAGKLCASCVERERKTKDAEEAGGKALHNHGPLMHGRIDEPIPYWSHLYDSAWYRLKVAGGAFLSKETMARVKAAVEKAQGTIEVPAAPAAPTDPPKRGRKPATVPATAEKAAPKRTKKVEKAPAEKVPVLGVILNPKPVEVEEIVEVEVEPITIEDHNYYIHWPTKKVYNMKCKYIGRLNSKERTIATGFPDSDAD